MLKKRLLLEYQRRKQSEPNLSVSSKITSSLFPQQINFIHDPNELAVACCTRRAGKSEGGGRSMVAVALSKPFANVLYIALTRGSAKNIMLPILKKFLKSIGVKEGQDYEFNMTELRFVFRNGSEIQLTGAGDHVSDIEKILGSAYDFILIDEAQSFPSHLRELVYDVLMIAIAERQGKIRVIGTPSIVASGFYYDVIRGKENEFDWSRHSWSWKDNPFNKHLIQAQVDKLVAKNPRIVDTPAFRRNYLGVWVADEDNLVYRYHADCIIPHYNIPHLDTFVLGVDLGYRDDTAFVVVGWNQKESQKAFIVYGMKRPKMFPSDITKHIEVLQSEYNIIKTVVDEGGLGKMIAEEWRTRYKIHVEKAQKSDKRLFIEEMNGSFALGTLFVSSECSDLSEEYRNLVWLDETKKHENPACSNHLTDAALYAWREARAFLYEAETVMDPLQAEEHELMEQALKRQEERDSLLFDVEADYDMGFGFVA